MADSGGARRKLSSSSASSSLFSQWFYPKVLAVSHIIHSNDHYVYLLPNKRAIRAYKRALMEGGTNADFPGVHVNTVPTPMERRLAQDFDYMSKIAVVQR